MTENEHSAKWYEAEDLAAKRHDEPYDVISGTLYLKIPRNVEEDSQLEELCNFVPYISAIITVHDGLEERQMIRLAGVTAAGRVLPEITVEAKDFVKLNWIMERWGPDCNIAIGGSRREHIRYALQRTADLAERIDIYRVTG